MSMMVILEPSYPLSTNLVAALTPATPAPIITILSICEFKRLNIRTKRDAAKLRPHLSLNFKNRLGYESSLYVY